MNSTHIHLLLNHFPIIGTLVGSALLVWGNFKKQQNLQQAGAVVILLMALMAIPVYLTGEPAEEQVENLPGVSESLIEQHEAAAQLAIWIMLLAGAAAFLALVLTALKRIQAKLLFTVAMLLSLVSFAAMARTGYYGGQIRHSELRSSAQGGNANGADKNESGNNSENRGENDDEKDKD